MEKNQTTDFKPVSKSERIVELDVLRGFALLGILLMNIEYFTNPFTGLFLGLDPVYTGWDKVADNFTLAFIQGKFWFLFSLLFGMGFVIMQTRARQAGRKFTGLYIRRLLGLLLIGIIHGVFIWSGDILISYAITGFVFMLFWEVDAKKLLIVGASLYVGFALLTASAGFINLAEMPEYVEQIEEMENHHYQAKEVYASGSFIEVTKIRFKEILDSAQQIALGGFFMILAVFLLGAWLMRAGKMHNVKENLPFFKKMLFVCFPIGALVSLWAVEGQTGANLMAPTSQQSIAATAGHLSSALLALAYMSALILLMQKFKAIANWLAPVGRMALTNYIAQSVVFSLFFNGYAFGFYGEISRAALIPLCIGFFVLQCLVSRWWLQSHRYGPLEWVWRTMTYGKI